jgi:hypothetical protein
MEILMLSKRRALPIFFLVLSVVALLPSAASAANEGQSTAQSPEDLARELIRLTGGGDIGIQIATQMVDALAKASPGIPKEFWTEFLSSLDSKKLEDLVIPIYVKNLTREEMVGTIQFYRSPVGQSMIRKLPAIAQESMAAGQQWGEQLARDAAERLKKYKQSHPNT